MDVPERVLAGRVIHLVARLFPHGRRDELEPPALIQHEDHVRAMRRQQAVSGLRLAGLFRLSEHAPDRQPDDAEENRQYDGVDLRLQPPTGQGIVHADAVERHQGKAPKMLEGVNPPTPSAYDTCLNAPLSPAMVRCMTCSRFGTRDTGVAGCGGCRTSSMPSSRHSDTVPCSPLFNER